RRIVAVAVGCALILVAGTWPQWQPRVSKSLSQTVKQSPAKPADATKASASVLIDTSMTPAVASSIVATDEAISPRPTPGPWPGSFWENDELVLASEKPIEISDVPLRKGQVIRARRGARAAVHVGRDGWRIDADEVRLNDVDFFATDPGTIALVTVMGRHVEFHGCSWQGSRESSGSAAIAWIEPSDSANAEDLLLCGELRLSDCLVQRVDAGIRREGRGAVLVELANVLHLGPGALLEVSDPPRGDDSLELIVSHVTLRDASALLLCRYDALPADPGQLIITAKDCALIPNADGGVVLFVGSAQPASLLRALEWTGHGSVIAQHAPLARWLDSEGVPHSAPDDAVAAAGLVRSDVGFAGEKTEGPSGSRIVRWQVPLQSTEPPGIRESRPLPAGTLR
ncbi:MAG TPA: hypothetical protein VHV77_12020, partial [Pirellulales bacterium]|nr:hypothetical protein [Pirellulales bacterium]